MFFSIMIDDMFVYMHSFNILPFCSNYRFATIQQNFLDEDFL